MSEIKSSNEWEKIVHSFKESGLTATQWCKDQKLSYHAFMYWHYKISGRVTNRAKPSKKRQETKWVTVDTNSSNDNTSSIDIKHSAKTISPQGIKISVGKANITVNTGFDKTLLQDIVKALAGLC